MCVIWRLTGPLKKWCAKWWSTFQLIQRSTKIAVLLGGVPVAAGAQALAAV